MPGGSAKGGCVVSEIMAAPIRLVSGVRSTRPATVMGKARGYPNPASVYRLEQGLARCDLAEECERTGLCLPGDLCAEGRHVGVGVEGPPLVDPLRKGKDVAVGVDLADPRTDRAVELPRASPALDRD